MPWAGRGLGCLSLLFIVSGPCLKNISSWAPGHTESMWKDIFCWLFLTCLSFLCMYLFVAHRGRRTSSSEDLSFPNNIETHREGLGVWVVIFVVHLDRVLSRLGTMRFLAVIVSNHHFHRTHIQTDGKTFPSISIQMCS